MSENASGSRQSTAPRTQDAMAEFIQAWAAFEIAHAQLYPSMTPRTPVAIAQNHSEQLAYAAARAVQAQRLPVAQLGTTISSIVEVARAMDHYVNPLMEEGVRRVEEQRSAGNDPLEVLCEEFGRRGEQLFGDKTVNELRPLAEQQLDEFLGSRTNLMSLATRLAGAEGPHLTGPER